MYSVTLGISKGSGAPEYHLYKRWIQLLEPLAECVDLSALRPEEAVSTLNRCGGLVLTGGGDIDPDLYERPEERERCVGMDRGRDKFELALLQRARLLNLPTFAIGRGMQLLNAFLGGTLVIDIPLLKPDALRHDGGRQEASHGIIIAEGSLLRNAAAVSEGTVNSAHHQAIDKLSWYLTPTASSSDKIVEAFEWSDQAEKPFLMAVQWHPERLPLENPLSGKLLQGFLDAAKAYVPHHRMD